MLERKWKEQGVRYGDFDEIGKDVTEELQAAYTEERLTKLTEALLKKDKSEPVPARKSYTVTEDMLEDPEWTVRYAHLEQMDPKESDLLF